MYKLLFSTMNRAHNLIEDAPILADREAYPAERSRTSPRFLARYDSSSYIPILQRRALAGEMVCLEDELISLGCAESLMSTTVGPSMCTHTEASDPFVSRCLQPISQGRPEGEEEWVISDSRIIKPCQTPTSPIWLTFCIHQQDSQKSQLLPGDFLTSLSFREAFEIQMLCFWDPTLWP